MENKAYLLVFDRRSNYDYNQLHEGIDKDPNIKNWSHYLTSSYILISPLSASGLSDRLRLNYFKDHRFLLYQITGTNYNGWLPKESWEWIKKYIL